MNSNSTTRIVNIFTLEQLQRSLVTTGLLMVMLLSGCGGGSSTASTSNTLPSPVASGIDGDALVPADDGQQPVTEDELAVLPKVSVGNRQYADPNVLITLQGSAEAAAGADIVKTLWTQVSGPAVTIPSPFALHNYILLPDVAVATNLVFRLTALDSLWQINSATVTVQVKPVPSFVKVIGSVVKESDASATFSVTLNAPNSEPVTVSYVTQNGTATGGSDFVPVSESVTFAAGELSKTISVALLTDGEQEEDETFFLKVTALDGETSHSNAGVAIIQNADDINPAPLLEQQLVFSDKGPVTTTQGESFSNPFDSSLAPGSGTVMYISSQPDIASVDQNGVVTGLAAGSATITVIKEADSVYAAAQSSYEVEVLYRGAAPVVTIYQQQSSASSSAVNDLAVSIENGASVSFYATAEDAEDGTLGAGKNTTVKWESSRDGLLSEAETLTTETVSEGTHRITFSAVDSDANVGSASFTLLVGNIAPMAEVSAEISDCSDAMNEDCFYGYNAIDSNLSLGSTTSDAWKSGLQQSLSLYWPYQATLNTIDIYTSAQLPIKGYTIKYWLSEQETYVTLVTVQDNKASFISHDIGGITTDELLIQIDAGPDAEPDAGRINEVVVFGNISNPSL